MPRFALTRALAASAVSVAALIFAAAPATAVVINFDASGIPGNGTMFVGAGDAEFVTITAGGYDVVLSGGVMLGPDIAFLPADSGVAYGTADFANSNGQSGYFNILTIQFFDAGTTNPANVTNFFVDVFNGNTIPVDYTLADDLGTSFTFNIADNLSSGRRTFGIATAGNTITIAGELQDPEATDPCFCAWDFFINNIGFNEALPPGSGPQPVPEPAIPALLALLPPALMWARRRHG